MIKFFSSIRRNLLSEGKTAKYLKYAIGEIVLVVVGILIAISLNNSNQQKNLKENVDNQLSLLRQSVYRDSLSFSGLIQYNTKQANNLKRLIQLMQTSMDEAKCKEFITNFNQLIEVRTNIADRSIYDEMVNSGAFSKIGEQNLKSQIANYYQLSTHFDEIIWMHVKDFRAFNNQVSMDGTISKAYMDENLAFSEQERCAYFNSLVENEEKKRMLENLFYSGISTYEQINNLYSVLIHRVMTGLPEHNE